MHEQSYYIEHYLKERKEKKKKERNKYYNSLEGLEKYNTHTHPQPQQFRKVYTLSFSSLEKSN